mmetsp:Transcript_107392/g.334773  ORF Transcript_107392/g.334773 Transcript_107392/m.334773 type:complete len:242 (+) Transcript_107392:288-1013(+)
MVHKEGLELRLLLRPQDVPPPRPRAGRGHDLVPEEVVVVQHWVVENMLLLKLVWGELQHPDQRGAGVSASDHVAPHHLQLIEDVAQDVTLMALPYRRVQSQRVVDAALSQAWKVNKDHREPHLVQRLHQLEPGPGGREAACRVVEEHGEAALPVDHPLDGRRLRPPDRAEVDLEGVPDAEADLLLAQRLQQEPPLLLLDELTPEDAPVRGLLGDVEHISSPVVNSELCYHEPPANRDTLRS